MTRFYKHMCTCYFKYTTTKGRKWAIWCIFWDEALACKKVALSGRQSSVGVFPSRQLVPQGGGHVSSQFSALSSGKQGLIQAGGGRSPGLGGYAEKKRICFVFSKDLTPLRRTERWLHAWDRPPPSEADFWWFLQPHLRAEPDPFQPRHFGTGTSSHRATHNL